MSGLLVAAAGAANAASVARKKTLGAIGGIPRMGGGLRAPYTPKPSKKRVNSDKKIGRLGQKAAAATAAGKTKKAAKLVKKQNRVAQKAGGKWTPVGGKNTGWTKNKKTGQIAY